MGLLDELEAASVRRPTQCTVCGWLRSQPPDKWEEAFNAPPDRITTAAIYAEMRRRGFNRSVNPVNRHRSGACGWRT